MFNACFIKLSLNKSFWLNLSIDFSYFYVQDYVRDEKEIRDLNIRINGLKIEVRKSRRWDEKF